MKTVAHQCPALADLPAPPRGCRGWPWDVETAPAPAAVDGQAWPKISVVTPSYKHGRYLEEAIRSVLLQGYPDVEYHVIDGGSNDETSDILRKYEPWLSSWVSERDRGQSDAINKGFARCEGEVCNWLCSDDVLAQGALQVVGRVFRRRPRIDVLAGACVLQFDEDRSQDSLRQVEWSNWQSAPYCGAIWQPSCFFRRAMIERDELVRTDLHFCMDRELWAYLWSRGAVWERTSEPLSVFRFTGANKTMVGGDKVIDELDGIHRSYFSELVPLPYVLRSLWLPLVRQSLRHPSRPVRRISRLASRGVTLALLGIYCRRRVRALQADFYHFGGGLADHS